MSLVPARRIAVTVSSGEPGFAVVELAVTPEPEVCLVVKPSVCGFGGGAGGEREGWVRCKCQFPRVTRSWHSV